MLMTLAEKVHLFELIYEFDRKNVSRLYFDIYSIQENDCVINLHYRKILRD